MIRLVFKPHRAGDGDRWRRRARSGGQKLVVERDLGEHTSKVQDGPWPAFPADLTSIAVALATQSEGEVMVHEWMFESRLFFCDKLISMGANIFIADPHRALVHGPRRLRAARVESPDIRAGMAVLLAALCAEGRTEIGNIRQIDRGYERIDERLRELGVDRARSGTTGARLAGRGFRPPGEDPPATERPARALRSAQRREPSATSGLVVCGTR